MQLTPASPRIFCEFGAFVFGKAREARIGVTDRRAQLNAFEIRLSASSLIVPGKSLAIISRTGHV